MVLPRSWPEFFGISATHIEKWQTALEKDESLLRWCLLNGQISEPKYFEWAMIRYAKPIVNGDFFDIPTDLMFWDRVKDLCTWMPHLLPLSEWEGVLTIGCLEPPTQLVAREPFRHQFVLASAHHLQYLWNNYHPEPRKELTKFGDTVAVRHGGEPNHDPAYVPQVPDAAPEMEKGAVKTASAETHGSAESNDYESGTNSGAHLLDEAPEGLNLGGTAANSGDSRETTSLTNTEAGAVDLMAEEPNLLEGLATIDPAAKAAELDFSALMSKSSKATQATPVTTAAKSPSSANPTAKKTPDLPPPNVPLPMATHLPKTGTPQSSPTAATTTMTLQNPTSTKSVVQPTGPVKQPPMTAPRVAPVTPPIPSFEEGLKADAQPSSTWEQQDEITNPNAADAAADLGAGSQILDQAQFVADITSGLEKSTRNVQQKPLSACDSLDDLCLQILIRVQSSFENGMVLTYKNNHLLPLKWTSLLLSVNGDKPKEILLENPSAFRIVARTLLPFHGAVVPNPVNNAFFTEFNRGKVPAHLTITPIVVERKLAGMVLGMSDQPVDYRMSLQRMEVLAGEAAREIRRFAETKAA